MIWYADYIVADMDIDLSIVFCSFGFEGYTWICIAYCWLVDVKHWWMSFVGFILLLLLLLLLQLRSHTIVMIHIDDGCTNVWYMYRWKIQFRAAKNQSDWYCIVIVCFHFIYTQRYIIDAALETSYLHMISWISVGTGRWIG